MIPVLYDVSEDNFTSNGLGALHDCISCKCTRETHAKNSLGKYELELEYPINGLHANLILSGRFILAIPQRGDIPQPFIITTVIRTSSKTIIVRAEQIAFQRLKNIYVEPQDNGYYTGTLKDITDYISSHRLPWDESIHAVEIYSDTSAGQTSLGVVFQSVPETMSIVFAKCLDAFEDSSITFNRKNVTLSGISGRDLGLKVQYGKNLIDLRQEQYLTDVPTHIFSYWKGTSSSSTDEIVIGSIYPIGNFVNKQLKTIAVDASSEFEGKPLITDLNSYTQQYISQNALNTPVVSIDVKFADLSPSIRANYLNEFYDVAINDVVTVEFPDLQIEEKTKVSKTVFDVLLERYDSITLGEIQKTISDLLATKDSSVYSQITEFKKWADYAIERANMAMAGQYGGNIKTTYDPDNHKPTSTMLMDSDDESTAQNILRMDGQGVYSSQSGSNGTFEEIVDIDGGMLPRYLHVKGEAEIDDNLNADKNVNVSENVNVSGSVNASAVNIGQLNVASKFSDVDTALDALDLRLRNLGG